MSKINWMMLIIALAGGIWKSQPCQASDLPKDESNKIPTHSFPKVGPMIKYLDQNSVTVMGVADTEIKATWLQKITCSNTKTQQDLLGVAFLNAGSHEQSYFKTFDLLAADHYVGYVTFNGLKPGQEYSLKIGYIHKDSQIPYSVDQINWTNTHTLTFQTESEYLPNQFSFLVGSCRRIGLKTPWMKRKGDIIFQAMQQNILNFKRSNIKTNALLFIGDQIYADATGDLWFPAKTDEDYKNLYLMAFSQPHFHQLVTNFDGSILMMRDDHEEYNDANAETALQKPAQHEAALKNYSLFQRPWGKETPEYWYTATNGVPMFFMDVRSERLPSQKKMISDAQMTALKAWLSDEKHEDEIKIVVTSVPFLLLQTEDSWGGYHDQAAEIINHLTSNNIQHVMFLSGDAHCQNDGLFFIHDSKGQKTGYSILEVLVSGLFAVSRGKAGQLTGIVEINDMLLKTGEPLKQTLKENLFARISGNHAKKEVTIQVYGDQNNLLRDVSYKL